MNFFHNLDRKDWVAFAAGFVALVALITTVTIGPAQPAPIPDEPAISWSPPSVEVTILRGTTQSIDMQFTSTRELSDVSLFVVPELSSLFRIPLNTAIGDIQPPRTYGIPVILEAPMSQPAGSYEGSVHIRSGSATVPSVLPVIINVQLPSNISIPKTVARASSDRITTTANGSRVVRDEITVILDANTLNPEADIVTIAQATNGVIIGSIPETSTYQLQYVANSLEELEQIRLYLINTFPQIDIAHFSWMVDPLTTTDGQKYPNDAEYQSWDEKIPSGNNWGLEVIKAPSAWNLETGDPSVKVGIIDVDFLPSHEDLAANVRLPVFGARTPGKSPGHGTHVAGTIGAFGNNGIGVTGVAWETTLMLYDHARGQVNLIQELMNKAADDGANIVNMSLGFGEKEPDDLAERIAEECRHNLSLAIERAPHVLWVFAAGNSKRDAKYSCPANLGDLFDNVITVAALGKNGELWSRDQQTGSNYGEHVAVAAPGENILSTVPSCSDELSCWSESDYDERNGTSVAAPHVAGLAALVFSKYRDSLPPPLVKDCIVNAAVNSGVFVTDPNGNRIPVINAPEAVKCQPPLKIFSFTCPSGDSCDGPQESTFYFEGSVFTPNGEVNRFVVDTATLMKTSLGPKIADPKGRITWSLPTACSDKPSLYKVYAVDVETDRVSELVTMEITPGDCAVPPTCTLTADPDTMIQGQSSTLSWTTTGAPTSAEIVPDIGPVSPSAGNTVVFPSADTTYTLTASNAAGSATCSAAVSVGPLPLPSGPCGPSGWTCTQLTDTVSPISHGPAIISKDGTKVGYVRLNQGTTASTDIDLLVLNSDGSNPVQIAPDLLHGSGPAPLSGDGSMMAFNARVSVFDGGSVYVSNTDNTGTRALVPSAGLGALSADGSTVVYNTRESIGNAQIHAINYDGTNSRLLVEACCQNVGGAGVGPEGITNNGSTIAFTILRGLASPAHGFCASAWRVGVINTDGSGFVHICPPIGDIGISETVISGDGSKVAFQTSGGFADIFVYDSDGTNQQRFDAPSALKLIGLTKDGLKVVYQSSGGVFVQNTDGSGLPLQLLPQVAITAGMNGDGNRIVLTSNLDLTGTGANSDGNVEVFLTAAP